MNPLRCSPDSLDLDNCDERITDSPVQRPMNPEPAPLEERLAELQQLLYNLQTELQHYKEEMRRMWYVIDNS